jgi:hypothetical protein
MWYSRFSYSCGYEGLRKKGETSNPNGRPRVIPELHEALSEALSKKSSNLTAIQRIINKLTNLACHGNIKAAELLFDRAYGRSKQSVDVGFSLPIIWHEEKTYLSPDPDKATPRRIG